MLVLQDVSFCAMQTLFDDTILMTLFDDKLKQNDIPVEYNFHQENVLYLFY